MLRGRISFDLMTGDRLIRTSDGTEHRFRADQVSAMSWRANPITFASGAVALTGTVLCGLVLLSGIASQVLQERRRPRASA